MSKRSFAAMLLAYLVPGAGHFYLGFRRRAAAFFLIVTVLFLLGLWLDGSLYTLAQSGGALLRVLASLGSMGAGLLYFFASSTGPHGDLTSITCEYGTTFMLSAGLMNLMLVLDVFDLSSGRKRS